MHQIYLCDNQFEILLFRGEDNQIAFIIGMLYEHKNTGRYELFDGILDRKANAEECCPEWSKICCEVFCEDGDFIVLV
jgi:hypothetical protein